MTSICIFGSQARQRTDKFSDRDVLIVASRPEDAVDERQHWEKSGWNVSLFTKEHFERLIAFKSLFIQHLKLEGVVVRDDHGYLSQRLAGFHPADSYIEELKDALLPVVWASATEANYWPQLCSGDILYVSIRNAAILHSATRGVHLYDYTQLIDRIVFDFGLKRSQRQALLGLRVIKAAYRSRQYGVAVGTSLSESILAMQQIRSAVLSLRDEAGSKFIPNHYHELRRKELELVRSSDPRYLDKLKPSHELFALWQLVCNPADYPKLRAAPEICASDSTVAGAQARLTARC